MIFLRVALGPSGSRWWKVLLGDGRAVSYLVVEGLLIGVVDGLLGGGFFPFVGLRCGRAWRWLIAVVVVEPRNFFS